MQALGIDIGGSGIKGAVVDVANGELVTERIRISTPREAHAPAVLEILHELIRKLGWKAGPVGIGFPGVIRENRICTAVNLHESLVGVNLAQELKDLPGGPVKVINDADAAGVAEMRFGAGRPCSQSGTVLLLTVGTGIGAVLFTNGVLVPNLELGHLEYRGRNAESYVAERARKEEGLSWKQWGKRFNGFLAHLEFVLQPDLIILGGGGVKKPEKFREQIKITTPWTIAASGNRAGLIGAALAATA
ncbi:MAG: polyphosphate--glucose phosphotransferase [Oceanipulchritudo sp.]